MITIRPDQLSFVTGGLETKIGESENCVCNRTPIDEDRIHYIERVYSPRKRRSIINQPLILPGMVHG